MFGSVDPYDKPFQRVVDPAWYTRVLIECGYHPFLLQRGQSLEQEVWAKSKEDVLRYSGGVGVVALVPRLYGGYTQVPTTVVLDEFDGGHVNVNGTHMSSQRKL